MPKTISKTGGSWGTLLYWREATIDYAFIGDWWSVTMYLSLQMCCELDKRLSTECPGQECLVPSMLCDGNSYWTQHNKIQQRLPERFERSSTMIQATSANMSIERYWSKDLTSWKAWAISGCRPHNSCIILLFSRHSPPWPRKGSENADLPDRAGVANVRRAVCLSPTLGPKLEKCVAHWQSPISELQRPYLGQEPRCCWGQ